MTISRTAIQDFSTANPIYANATVTAYTVENGAKTSTKAALYTSNSGTTRAANPQTLDSYGKFRQPVYIDDPVILTISGLGNTPEHDTGIISASIRKDIVISSAEMLALHTTPKTLVAAPGAGKALIFESAIFFLDYNSAAYVLDAGDDINIRYTDGSGALAATLETTGFLDQTSDKYALLKPASGSLILPTNTPLVASLGGAVLTGNSPVATRIFYSVVDVSTLLTA